MNRENLLRDLNTAMEETEALISTGDSGLDLRTRAMYRKCFMDTAERTLLLPGMKTTDAAGIEHVVSDEIFVITGDINAMWLRDSSAQVVHYLPFAGRFESVREMIESLIKRQRICILRDPYANAFLEWKEGQSEWKNDVTAMQPGDWERKYETDSLSYHIWLVLRYIAETKDYSVLDGEQIKAFETILELWKNEQKHMTDSSYRFERPGKGPKNNPGNGGMGAPVAFTGMTWSGFRPSDDACVYGYNIPGNLFAAKVLENLCEILKSAQTGGVNQGLSAEKAHQFEKVRESAEQLRQDITRGIEEYGLVLHEEYGKIYAYETDGLGNSLLMDDANVPSLLSLPWLGVCGKTDERYLNTRRFVLSSENPWYFSGRAAKGIGSPHTGERCIWPIALIMQGLTASDRGEQLSLLRTLLDTDAGCIAMHESFDADEPSAYSRSWFAWADSLYALFVMNVFC